MHTLAHTHFGSALWDMERTFIYLKWIALPDTSSSLVIFRGQSNIGTREATCPIYNLTPFATTAA
jgi:hypothetical protein